MKTQDKQIQYWAHMLDEAMEDKSALAKESVEGMSKFVPAQTLAKANAEDMGKPPTLKQVTDLDRIRICETPDGGVMKEVKLADTVMPAKYSKPFYLPTGTGSYMAEFYYSADSHHTVEMMVFSKNATLADVLFAKFLSTPTPADLKAVPKDVADCLVEICAGYVISRSTCRFKLLDVLLNPKNKIERTVNKQRQREANWKMKTAADIEIDRKFGKVRLPDDWDDWDDAEMDKLRDVIDGMFDGDTYDQFVPDKYEDVDGTQRDVDDWDVYSVNYQDTITEDEFWDRLFEELPAKFGPGVDVRASELYGAVWELGEKIAQDAWENYDPDESQMTYRGRMRWGGYYPG